MCTMKDKHLKLNNIIIDKINQQKELISNYDYINWIENFTLEYPCFSTDSWLYFPEQISLQDYTKVEKLDSFFSALLAYCDKYLINTSKDNLDAFEASRIHIKYNNVGYTLSLFIGQGSIVTIERSEITGDFIDFESIVNNVEPKEFKTKESLLNSLESVIKELKQLDMSLDSIVSKIKKYYD